jgi:hypothetical protein
MNQNPLNRVIIKTAGLILIASMGFVMYLSYQGRVEGLYLGWALVFLFCITILLEAWLDFRKTGSQNDSSADTGQALAKISQSFSQSVTSQSEGQQKLVEKLDSVLRELPETLKANAQAIKEESARAVNSVAEFTGALRTREEELIQSQQQIMEKMTDLADKLGKSSAAMEESGNLSLANQTELQASVEMLNSGLQQIIEKVESKVGVQEEENAFLEKLHNTLEAFHERSTEILIENSLKTREILLGSSALPKDESAA